MYFHILLQYNLRTAVGFNLLCLEESFMEHFFWTQFFTRLDFHRDEYCFARQYLHTVVVK